MTYIDPREDSIGLLWYFWPEGIFACSDKYHSYIIVEQEAAHEDDRYMEVGAFTIQDH